MDLIQVSARLTAPIVTTYVNTDQIEFERAKQGVWGFRSDKVDNINGYECKVRLLLMTHRAVTSIGRFNNLPTMQFKSGTRILGNRCILNTPDPQACLGLEIASFSIFYTFQAYFSVIYSFL